MEVSSIVSGLMASYRKQLNTAQILLSSHRSKSGATIVVSIKTGFTHTQNIRKSGPCSSLAVLLIRSQQHRACGSGGQKFQLIKLFKDLQFYFSII